MEIGELYMVEIPGSDGREQAGNRPAIIVQSSEFTKHLPTVLVVPTTSKMKAQSFSGTYLVGADEENKLNKPTVALVFQLRAIDKRRITWKIGKLKDSDLEEIHSLIKSLTEIK